MFTLRSEDHFLKVASGLYYNSIFVTALSTVSRSNRIDLNALVMSKKFLGGSSSESIACCFPFLPFFFFFSEPLPELLLPLDFELPLSEPLSLPEPEPDPEPLSDPDPLPLPDPLPDSLPLPSFSDSLSLPKGIISYVKFTFEQTWKVT